MFVTRIIILIISALHLTATDNNTNILTRGIYFKNIGRMIKHTNIFNIILPIQLLEYDRFLNLLNNHTLQGFAELENFIPKQKHLYQSTIENDTKLYHMRSYSEIAAWLFSEKFRTNTPNISIPNNELVTKLESIISERIISEKDRISNLFQSTTAKYSKVKNLFTVNEKYKRGLIDLGGEISKALFGTATSADISKLNAKIQKNYESNQKILKINNKLISILSLQNLEIGNLTQHMSKIEDNMITLIDDLSIIQRKLKMEAFLIVKNMFFESIDRFSNTVKNLLLGFQIKLNSLSESIFGVINNELTPNLINPNEMRKILISATKHIPQQLFPIPLMFEQAYFDAYRHLTTNFIRFNDSYSIVINIPLINTEQQFDITETFTLPVPLSNNSNFTSELVFPYNKYIITTLDKNKIAIMDKQDLEQCKQFNQFFLCNCNIQFDKNSKLLNCINEILTNNDNTDHCARKIKRFNTSNKFVYVSDNIWAYYLYKTQTVKITCHIQNNGPDSSKKVNFIKLNRIGFFRIEPNCALDADEFSIPESFEIETKSTMLQFSTTFNNISEYFEPLKSIAWQKIESPLRQLDPVHLSYLKTELRSNELKDEKNRDTINQLLQQVTTIQHETEYSAYQQPILTDNQIINITFGTILTLALLALSIFSYKLYVTRQIISEMSYKIKDIQDGNKKLKTKVKSFVKEGTAPLPLRMPLLQN